MTSFVESFVLGKDVASTRARLAETFSSPEDPRVQDYILKRKRLEDTNSWKEGLGKVVGYFWGNYTTFCPFQHQLDLFDERVKEYRLHHYTTS